MLEIVSFNDRLHCRDIICDISFETRERLNKAFYISEEAIQWSSLQSDIDLQRLLLLSGSYGDFPPITLPCKAGYVSKWLPRMKGSLNRKVDIDGILEAVAASIPDIAPTKWCEHVHLYRVVHFIRCIRHDVIKSTMESLGFPWNPVVSFSNPFIYKKGRVEHWVLDNNIFKSELIEFVYNVYHCLIATSASKSDYEFILLKFTEEDVNRYNWFDYVKKDLIVQTKVCELVSEMRDALNLFDSYLRRLELKTEATAVTPDNLYSVLQDLYRKLTAMKSYVSLL